MIENDIDKEISERIKCFREYLNVSQKYFSEEFNIKQSVLSDIERGKQGPSRQFISFLIKKYNLNVNWLFTGQGSMFTDKEVYPEPDEKELEKIRKEKLKLEIEVEHLKKSIQDLEDINDDIQERFRTAQEALESYRLKEKMKLNNNTI